MMVIEDNVEVFSTEHRNMVEILADDDDAATVINLALLLVITFYFFVSNYSMGK